VIQLWAEVVSMAKAAFYLNWMLVVVHRSCQQQSAADLMMYSDPAQTPAT